LGCLSDKGCPSNNKNPEKKSVDIIDPMAIIDYVSVKRYLKSVSNFSLSEIRINRRVSVLKLIISPGLKRRR
jgi:hypothetical protein